MTRHLTCLTVIVLAVAPLAHAVAQAAPSTGQQAKYADQALKSCNYDLDHDHFSDYATIEDCVADRTQKLSRADQAKTAHASKPN